MFKFEFFAKGSGNNFYLDNVKLVTAIGVEEEKLGLSRINIFPNPSAGDFNIELDVIQQDIFNINLLDINGRLVDVILKDEKLSIGHHVFERGRRLVGHLQCSIIRISPRRLSTHSKKYKVAALHGRQF